MDRRTLVSWSYMAFGAVGALAIELTPVLILGRPQAHAPFNPGAVALLCLGVAGGSAWMIIFATLGFRRLDEFVREASKFAWYWGSAVGIAVSAPIFVFVSMGGLHWVSPSVPAGAHLARAFQLGYTLPLFAQVGGFLAFRAWWALAKR